MEGGRGSLEKGGKGLVGSDEASHNPGCGSTSTRDRKYREAVLRAPNLCGGRCCRELVQRKMN